jgi:uncharacterized protein YecT (DUF1311 family)
MMKLTVMVIAIIFIPCQLAHSDEVLQPHEGTSRGVIASQAAEAYKQAIKSCYHSAPGSPLNGPQFLACLKQQVRSESATLDAIYSGTISYLKASPGQTARLRQAQRAWLQFQDANCGFASAVAPRSDADEFFFDCVLRSTIDRYVELRSLVGD